MTLLANLSASEAPLEFNGSSGDATGPLITLFVPLLMFSTGLLGNVVALVLLWRSRRDHSRSVFYRLVAGLALTDLLGTLATSPVTLLVYSNDRQWVGGQATCDYFSFMMIFAGLATVLVVGCMAIERYLAIIHPYTYERHVRPQRANCTLVAVWIIAAFTSCLPLVKVGRNVRHWPGTWCFFDFYSDRTVDKVFAFFFAIVGLLVIAATAICNVAIMIVLLRMRRVSQNIGKSREGRTLNMTSEMQMIFFLAGIILVFAACYSPLMVRIILNVTEAVSVDVQWDLLAIRLASVNQILDPWVYLLFRRRLAALLYSVCKSVSPLHTLSSLKALRSPEIAQDTSLKNLTRLQLTPTGNGPDSPGLRTLNGSDSIRLCDSPGLRDSLDLPDFPSSAGLPDSSGLRDLPISSGFPDSLDVSTFPVLPDSSSVQGDSGLDEVSHNASVSVEQSPHQCSSEDPQCESGITLDNCVTSFTPDGKKSGEPAILTGFADVDGQCSPSGSFLPKRECQALPCAISSESEQRLRKASCENAALSLEDDVWCENRAQTNEKFRAQQCPQLVYGIRVGRFSLPKIELLKNKNKSLEQTESKVPEKSNAERNLFAFRHKTKPDATETGGSKSAKCGTNDSAACDTKNTRKRSVDNNAKCNANDSAKYNTDCKQKQSGNILNLISLKIPSTFLGKRTQRKNSKDPPSHTQDVKLTTSASWPVICRHGNQAVIRMDSEEEAEVTDCLPSFKKRHSENESDCLPLLNTRHSRMEPPCSQCKLFADQPVTYV